MPIEIKEMHIKISLDEGANSGNSATDTSKSISLAFNENVYLKDGFIMGVDAPFGASVTIAVSHPLLGTIEYFGKHIPVFGTGWWPLNTEDRALLPLGLSVIITVENSRGSSFDEDEPASFKIVGRLEMFRPKMTFL